MRIAVRHQLIGLLGGRVQRDRMIDIVVLRKRQPRIGAVYRARGRVNQVPDSRLSRPFEHVAEAHQISVDVRGRVDHRVTHARLRREMGNHIEVIGRKQMRHGFAVGDVHFMEREFRVAAQAGKAGFLEADVVIVVEVVYADDRVAALQQAHSKRGADKSRRAGNQDIHWASSQIPEGCCRLASSLS